MNIKGFQKLSLVDYDGYISCTIFLGGCNFRCPFCHNSALVTSLDVNKFNNEDISLESILSYLDKRKGIIQAVCVTGGEPTINHDLKEMLLEIKKRGYFIKLDTNGTNLLLLKELLEEKIIDYVAMDVKNSLNKYKLTTNSNIDSNIIKQTIDFLINSEYEYEFRTTLVEEFHKEEDIQEMASLLKGAKRLFLQKFINSENCIDKSLHEVCFDKATNYKDVLNKTIKNVSLRGY